MALGDLANSLDLAGMSSLKDLTPIQNAVSSSSVPGSKENGPGMGGDKSDSNADSTGNGEPGATDDAKPKTPRELADDYLTILLHSMAFNVFMGVLTMFALVADDARLAFAEREDDWWLQGMSAVGMVSFAFCKRRFHGTTTPCCAYSALH